jgi:hypothetical protein
LAVAEAHGASRLTSRTGTRISALVVAVLAGVGCEASGAATSTPAAQADAGACPREENLEGADVSFANDLKPFFSTTSAFGGCHDGNTRQAGLYLGPNFLDGPATAQNRADALASLLSISRTAPSMHRVTPFDPTRSFLMLKVEGCQNRMGLTCGGAVAGKPCGDRMPGQSDELPSEKKSLLARWIARGAVGDIGDASADATAQ